METGALLFDGEQKAPEIMMESDMSCTPAVMPPPDVMKEQTGAENEGAELKEAEAAVPESEQPDKRQGNKNFCGKCSSYRPPRAHHCSMCNRCVMRMDHHWCVTHVCYIWRYLSVCVCLCV
jgi:ribosomal protein L40E